MMVTLLFLFVLAIAGTTEHARAQTFVPGCTLPFDAIKVHHPGGK